MRFLNGKSLLCVFKDIAGEIFYSVIFVLKCLSYFLRVTIFYYRHHIIYSLGAQGIYCKLNDVLTSRYENQ